MQHQPVPVVSKPVASGTNTQNHLENFERFFQDLNKAAKSILPRVSRKYSGVVVLLIRWEYDDLDTETEINDLEQLFRDAYHYRTETYLIPSIDSTTELEQRLLSFRTTYDTGDNLLVLYYGGHGSLEPGKQNAGRSVWHARANGPEKLVWSDLQGVLERAKSDVVFILDRCYAPSATTSAGSKEGLWACNSGLPTTCVDDNSFTRHLIEELKTLSTSSLINIAMLHARLMRHVGKPGSPTLLKEPWYTNMGEVALPSAEITPQPQLSTLDNCLKVDKGMTETLALLAVRLQDVTSAPSRWRIAERLQREVLENRIRSFGTEYPDSLASQGNLASTYYQQGRLHEAARSQEQMLKARAQTLGEEHPDALISQNNLALTHREQGRLNEVTQLLKPVVKLGKQTLAETHPHRPASQHALARTYESNGQIEEAVHLLDHAVKVQEHALAQAHPHRLASQHAPARAYMSNGQTKEAMRLLEQVVTIHEQILAHKHPNWLATQLEPARAHLINGHFEEAVQILRSTLFRFGSSRL
ncbi:MAG: hypothetical protein Q9159_005160 [Coniocarpon cinnabarinum]